MGQLSTLHLARYELKCKHTGLCVCFARASHWLSPRRCVQVAALRTPDGHMISLLENEE